MNEASPEPSAALLSFLGRLPITSADAMAVLGSSLAHAAVHRQVVDAHRVAEIARRQADHIAAAGRELPPGRLRAAAESLARLHAITIDAWLETANAYGRAFARKAFAFPVAPRLRD